MWDQSDQHIRWVIAASASVAVGHAAMDAAIANYPKQRLTLRNGILVIRQRDSFGRFPNRAKQFKLST
jgi:6-phosphogluconate dehydrogenase